MQRNSTSSNAVAFTPYKLIFAYKWLTAFSVFIGLVAIGYAVNIIWSTIIPLMDITCHLLPPVIALLMMGLLLPLFTSVGFCGIIKSNKKNLTLCYYALSFTMFIVLVSGVYSIGTETSIIQKKNGFPLQQAIEAYHGDTTIAKKMDSVQKLLGCCGVYRPDDWEMNTKFACDDRNKNIFKCNVPTSCCYLTKNQLANTKCGMMVLNKDAKRKNLIYEDGCESKIKHFVWSLTVHIMCTHIIMFISQLIIWKLTSCAIFAFEKSVEEPKTVSTQECSSTEVLSHNSGNASDIPEEV